MFSRNFYNADAHALCTANRHIWLLKQLSCFLHKKYRPRPVCWTCALSACCYILISDPATKFLPRWITRLLRYFVAQQVSPILSTSQFAAQQAQKMWRILSQNRSLSSPSRTRCHVQTKLCPNGRSAGLHKLLPITRSRHNHIPSFN